MMAGLEDKGRLEHLVSAMDLSSDHRCWPLACTQLQNNEFDASARRDQLALHGRRALIIGPKVNPWTKPLEETYDSVETVEQFTPPSEGEQPIYDLVIIYDFIENHLPTIIQFVGPHLADHGLLISYNSTPSSCRQILLESDLPPEIWSRVLRAQLSKLNLKKDNFLRREVVRYLMQVNLEETFEEKAENKDDLRTRLSRFSTTNYLLYMMDRIKKSMKPSDAEAWLGIIRLIADVFESHPKTLRKLVYGFLFERKSNRYPIHNFLDLQELMSKSNLVPVGGGPEGSTYLSDRHLFVNSNFQSKFDIREVLFEKSKVNVKTIPKLIKRNLALSKKEQINRINKFRPTVRVANQSITESYDRTVTKAYFDEFKKSCPNLIQETVDRLLTEGGNREDLFLKIYHYLQDNLVNHPIVQPLNPVELDESTIDPGLILYMGIGRCSQAAKLAVSMFSAAGFESRIAQLHCHVVAEVKVDDRWRVVDIFSFKDRVYPKLISSPEWATLDELRENPQALDAIPARGLIFSGGGPLFQSDVGQSRGYIDSGLPWERYYTSFLYFGVNKVMPQRPPDFRVEVDKDRKKMKIGLLDSNGAAKVRWSFSSSPRAWSYDSPAEVESYSVPNDLGTITWQESDGCKLEINYDSLDHSSIYVNVQAWNRYMASIDSFYAWPFETPVGG